MASGRAYQLRIPSSSPDTGWPLFFGKAAEWLKISHMLPQHYPQRDCKAICARSFRGQHEPLNKKRGVTLKIYPAEADYLRLPLSLPAPRIEDKKINIKILRHSGNF